MNGWESVTLALAFGALLLMGGVAAYRALRRESPLDLLIALDLTGLVALGIMALTLALWHSPFTWELVLAGTLLGFLTTVFATAYLARNPRPSQECEGE
jgi:multisubunit Na+/H+ antiporter MnhF subunit